LNLHAHTQKRRRRRLRRNHGFNVDGVLALNDHPAWCERTLGMRSVVLPLLDPSPPSASNALARDR